MSIPYLSFFYKHDNWCRHLYTKSRRYWRADESAGFWTLSVGFSEHAHLYIPKYGNIGRAQENTGF